MMLVFGILLVSCACLLVRALALSVVRGKTPPWQTKFLSKFKELPTVVTWDEPNYTDKTPLVGTNRKPLVLREAMLGSRTCALSAFIFTPHCGHLNNNEAAEGNSFAFMALGPRARNM